MTTTSLWLFLRKKNYSPHYQIQITANQNRIPTHPAGGEFQTYFSMAFPVDAGHTQGWRKRKRGSGYTHPHQ